MKEGGKGEGDRVPACRPCPLRAPRTPATFCFKQSRELLLVFCFTGNRYLAHCALQRTHQHAWLFNCLQYRPHHSCTGRYTPAISSLVHRHSIAYSTKYDPARLSLPACSNSRPDPYRPPALLSQRSFHTAPPSKLSQAPQPTRRWATPHVPKHPHTRTQSHARAHIVSVRYCTPTVYLHWHRPARSNRGARQTRPA